MLSSTTSVLALGGVAGAVAVLEDELSSSTATAPATPPKAKTEVVEDNIHGHKIADPYRWLENSQASDTQQYVNDELAYTRSILDPLPGRAQTHQRLTQLLSIG